ncbi:hypothetical protein GOP47_0022426 [Adiantum capillus-veneris]|uniref:Uncharacterized protein n=1 Tax=Adiantum capillus-veneris TaxID=13818 RepID=A0A9D4U6F7_ADICA|nr:hypothetical protein GOP47_0022426 [Adiantum capillus-veneris]
MPKSRPARKGSISRAGEDQPTPPNEELTLSTDTVKEPNEELQSLKSAVQLLAKQQAVQAQCVNQLMNKIKGDVLSDVAQQNVGFPLPTDPANYQLRSGALSSEQEASNGSENPGPADVLDEPTTTGSHAHPKATERSRARVGKDSDDLQNWVAWKWRWAVEANKAKELSQRINELNNNKGKVNRDVVRRNNHRNYHSRSKDDSMLARGWAITRPAKLNLKALPAPVSSPTSTHSPSAQAFENDDGLGWKASSTQIQSLQKQVSRLTGCFNKMMPTLIFLVNRAGSQKLVNHCFSQWKAVSNMKSTELHHLRRESNPIIKPCSRVLKGLGIAPVNDSTSQRKRVQRKASMAEYIQPKFERTPYASSTSATLKALHTLQVSLHHELQELQGIMASEMENLKRQVEARRPPTQNMKRYGGCGEGLRWKNDLLSVWEICNNVAQLLNKARYKLTSNGEHLPVAAVQPRGRVPIQHRNRHRYACHPIISVTTPEPRRGPGRSFSAAPIIRITSSEAPPPTPIGRRCGETMRAKANLEGSRRSPTLLSSTLQMEAQVPASNAAFIASR